MYCSNIYCTNVWGITYYYNEYCCNTNYNNKQHLGQKRREYRKSKELHCERIPIYMESPQPLRLHSGRKIYVNHHKRKENMMILKKPIYIITILSLMFAVMLAVPQPALAVPGRCPAGTSYITKYNWSNGSWVVDSHDPDFITFGPDEDGDGPDAQDGSWNSGVVLIQAVVITDGFYNHQVITVTYYYNPAVSFGYYHAADMLNQPPNHPPHDISNIVFCGDTTPIELASFTAQASRGRVGLEWVTATELDTAGFTLFRSDTEGGTRVQVTPQLIAAQGSGVTGASYSFIDYPGNGTFYYWLSDVDYSGQSGLHGPIAVRVYPTIRLPEYRPSMPGY